ncbi:Tat pathway signal sequence domain protein, partial [Streptomyces hydrogenans]
MYEIVRRHLGKVVAGAAMAVTGTAVAVAISLPGTAGAEDTPAGRAAGPAAAPGRARPGRSPDPGLVGGVDAQRDVRGL